MLDFDITVARSTLIVKASGRLTKGITALTGPSGSGKSTIIKSLAGLIRPQAGHVVFDDMLWFDGDKHIFIEPQKRLVGYVPQGNIVFPHMSVQRNIMYSKRGDEALLERILTRLQLVPYKETKAGQLSGGEQQRVALGRALYAKPGILLLDEPLSSLDWDLRKQVRNDLVDIIKEWRIPCLWVTHDQDEAEAVGDAWWRCTEGRLVTHEGTI
ncbi:ATP-binding cassette domain-containing protein [uncultured Veillonella sp.]|uniref:ATP-binding cassette domain-containing protein n=1 Tax=uncultured Veillonella sp. TaxID=159268 RepID=UPI002602A010|nr:ATP-binding cassette domain-containing protein [uncultured Veillonella sp.]